MYEYPCIPLPTCRKHAFFKRHNQMSYSVTAFHSKLGTPGWYTTFSMWSIGKFQQSGELKKHSHFFFLHFQSPSAYKKGENEVVQSCLTLWDLRGFSIHGIFQVRVLEWVAIFFSRGSSWPRDCTWVSCIAGRSFTLWATREAHTYPPDNTKVGKKWNNCNKNLHLKKKKSLVHYMYEINLGG